MLDRQEWVLREQHKQNPSKKWHSLLLLAQVKHISFLLCLHSSLCMCMRLFCCQLWSKAWMHTVQLWRYCQLHVELHSWDLLIFIIRWDSWFENRLVLCLVILFNLLAIQNKGFVKKWNIQACLCVICNLRYFILSFLTTYSLCYRTRCCSWSWCVGTWCIVLLWPWSF